MNKPNALVLVRLLLLASPCFASPVYAQASFSEQSQAAGLIVQHDPADALEISTLSVTALMIGGMSAGDFNNDGWQDLFVVVGGGAPDKLFINNGNGTFTDQAAAWHVADAHMGIGAAVGDYNRDGWLDIFVTSFGSPDDQPMSGQHRLYRNNGNNSFTNVAAAANVSIPGYLNGFGPAFGDYDLDGDLDLFVAGWLSGGNRLLRNNGNGTFTNVTTPAGLSGSIRGFGATFVDMNDDRFPELLVAADFGTSRYYINDTDGTFTNHTVASGTGLDDNGMGHAIADINRDGMLDWFVTSIYSPNTGMPNVPGTGNMLYLNSGFHSYHEEAVPYQVNDGGWGWGTVAIDFDHDGWLEIAETNGWPVANGFGVFEWVDEPSYLWKNDGIGFCDDIAPRSGFEYNLQGRGMLNFDYDNDGDQDIAIFTNHGPMKLFRNDLPPTAGHWIRIFLNTADNPKLAPNGYGTKVIATTNNAVFVRNLCGGMNYLSQSELSVHFGLANALSVDLRVEWTDGTITIREDVPVNQTIVVNYGLLGDITGDGVVNVLDLLAVIGQWGQTGPGVPADLNSDQIVNVLDLLMVIANWG